MSFWRLFYYVVWATKERAPLLSDDRASVTELSLRSVCEQDQVIVHALFIMPDHVHFAVSVPPPIAIADFLHRLKGSSSHLLNHDARVDRTSFAWQSEYGILSFGERSLPEVISYVRNQAAHHADNDLRPRFELTTKPYLPADLASPGGAS